MLRTRVRSRNNGPICFGAREKKHGPAVSGQNSLRTVGEIISPAFVYVDFDTDAKQRGRGIAARQFEWGLCGWEGLSPRAALDYGRRDFVSEAALGSTRGGRMIKKIICQLLISSNSCFSTCRVYVNRFVYDIIFWRAINFII